MAEGRRSAADAAAGRRKTLVICDDDPDIRCVYAGLARSRYRVLEAGDGESALELIREHKPELMFLDLSMPGIDGLATLERALRLQPALAVTMLTAVTDIDKAKQALSLGARAYMTKPIDCRNEEFWSRVEPELQDRPEDRPWRLAV